MELDLTPFFTTKAQANDFSNRLEIIAEGLFQTNFQLEHALLEQFGIYKKDKFMVLLQEHKIPIDSTPALKDFFAKIKEAITSLHTISMTVAVEPDDALLRSITEWFPMQLHKQILLDIIVNPDLIAGATISYRGKYLDNSIKKLFRQIVDDIVAKEHEEQLQNRQTKTNSSNGDHVALTARSE